MRKLIYIVTLLAFLMAGGVQAKSDEVTLSWDDNANASAKSFHLYVCDQSIPDVPVDEFGGAIESVQCAENFQVETIAWKNGATVVDIVINLVKPVGTLHFRADVEGNNGVHSALSNEETLDYDYEAPQSITITVKFKR